MPPKFAEEAPSEESIRAVKAVLQFADTNNDGKLDVAEEAVLKQQYREFHKDQKEQEILEKLAAEAEALEKSGGSSSSTLAGNSSCNSNEQEEGDEEKRKRRQKAIAMKAIKQRYDADGDGNLDDHELKKLRAEIHLTEGAMRYFFYVSVLARSMRYFRFLFKDFVSATLLWRSYVFAACYITFDVFFEMFHAWSNPATTRLQIAHVGVKRFSFDICSSIVLPMYVLKFVNKQSTHFFSHNKHVKHHGGFVKFGPAFCTLGTIPMLPYLLDKPVAWVVDKVFGKTAIQKQQAAADAAAKAAKNAKAATQK